MSNELVATEAPKNLGGRPTVWDRQEVVNAVAKCRGNFTEAAKLLSLKYGKSCRRQTVSDVMKESEATRAAMVDIHGQLFDGGFSIVVDAALDHGDIKAGKILMDALGPHYGLA